MIVENAQQPVDRLAQRGGRIIAYRGLQVIYTPLPSATQVCSSCTKSSLLSLGAF